VLLGVAVVAAGACTDRGSVTFQVRTPEVGVFNPVSTRLSEYELKTTTGDLVGVATVSATATDSAQALLGLGPLQLTPAPVDVVMSLFSGTELQGMARIRDVMVRKEQTVTYDAFVRKPLVFVGAALPAETIPGNSVADGKILDFTGVAMDLEHPKPAMPGAPKMPDSTNASAVTSDGTLLLAGRANKITVYDTGTANQTDLPLSFTPVKIVVAARDAAAVALDGGDASGGAVALFPNVAMLKDDVAGTSPQVIKLPGVNPRTAAFSTDGQTVYVLGGGSVDPCSPGTAPQANTITLIGVDGIMKASWALPDFVSDVAVQSDGSILITRSTAGQVALLVPGTDTGAPAPRNLFAAKCPTAMHLTGSQLLVVTAAKDPDFDNTFVLMRASMTDPSPMPSTLALGAPTFEVPTEDTTRPSPMPGPMVSITLKPVSLFAYDLAVTPDGLRAVFAARIRYHHADDHFTILGTDCTATLDISEYGLYTVDTASGNASYESRSQILTTPVRDTDPCIICPLGFPIGDVPFYCPSAPGDKPAGLAAIFGDP
jgi:hypothetical protein